MAKRLILVLGVMAVLIMALGFVKFRQIESAVHAGAFQPPPEAVTSIVTQREQWPATHDRDRHHRSGSRRHGQRRPSWHCRANRLRFRSSRCETGTFWSNSTRGRSGPNWPRSRRSATWRRSNFGRTQQLVNAWRHFTDGLRPGHGSAKGHRSKCGGDPRHD